MRKKVYYPFQKVKDERTRDGIDKVMHQLERYGRAETSNGDIPRTLAYRYREAKNEGLIKFAYNHQHKSSLVVLKPGYKLKPISPQRRKFKFEREF